MADTVLGFMGICLTVIVRTSGTALVVLYFLH